MATVKPGSSLGFLNLGDSLQSVITRIRADPSLFPSLQVIYSESKPLELPVIVVLKYNGLRLQFDGPTQRLRLIEVVSWGKMKIVYKGYELGRQGAPLFRSIYNKIFGPTYPGELDSDTSTYVLSYPGVAFSFEVDASKLSATSSNDHISVLSGPTGPVCSCMSIFAGNSWDEAKKELFSNLYFETQDLIEVDYVEVSCNSYVVMEGLS